MLRARYRRCIRPPTRARLYREVRQPFKRLRLDRESLQAGFDQPRLPRRLRRLPRFQPVKPPVHLLLPGLEEVDSLRQAGLPILYAGNLRRERVQSAVWNAPVSARRLGRGCLV